MSKLEDIEKHSRKIFEEINGIEITNVKNETEVIDKYIKYLDYYMEYIKFSEKEYKEILYKIIRIVSEKLEVKQIYQVIEMIHGKRNFINKKGNLNRKSDELKKYSKYIYALLEFKTLEEIEKYNNNNNKNKNIYSIYDKSTQEILLSKKWKEKIEKEIIEMKREIERFEQEKIEGNYIEKIKEYIKNNDVNKNSIEYIIETIKEKLKILGKEYIDEISREELINNKKKLSKIIKA